MIYRLIISHFALDILSRKLDNPIFSNVKVKKYKTVLVTVTVALAFASSLLPGRAQTLNLSGGTLKGSLVNQELIGTVGGPPAFPVTDVGVSNGVISTWVVQDSSLDSQGDIFIYQTENDGPSAIDNVELTGFNIPAGVVLSTATYSALGGSLSLPGSMTPSSSGNFPSESTFQQSVTFEDGDLANNSTPSYFLVVDTDVNYFSASYGQIEDDFSAAGNILAPVPEPPSSILLLAGLACLYGIFRYRRAVL